MIHDLNDSLAAQASTVLAGTDDTVAIEAHNYIVETFVTEQMKKALSDEKEEDRQTAIARRAVVRRTGRPVGRPSRPHFVGPAAEARRTSSGLDVSPPAFRLDDKVLARLTDQVEGEWSTDMFEVARLTNNRPLTFVGQVAFAQHDLVDACGLPEGKVLAFLQAMDSGYRGDIPYHTNVHAADVLHSLNYLMAHGLAVKGNFGAVHILAALLAAVVHDYQHPGRSNQFLVDTGDELAMRYNDVSPLENMHLCEALKVLQRPEHNFLADMAPQQHRHLRSTAISMVLGTDMSHHFEHLAEFKAQVTDQKRMRLAAQVELTDSQRQLVLKIALHVCDIANATKREDVYLKWNNAIIDEFYQQGDEELRRGMAISPLCDRREPRVAQVQCGFIDLIVRPVFKGWFSFMSDPELSKQVGGWVVGWLGG